MKVAKKVVEVEEKYEDGSWWKRYRFEGAWVVGESFKGGSKSVRIYNVGEENLKLLSELFDFPIEEHGGSKWISTRKDNFEVTIFA